MVMANRVMVGYTTPNTLTNLLFVRRKMMPNMIVQPKCKLGMAA